MAEKTKRPLLKTRCCKCGHHFQFHPSIAMLSGMNSGHLSCPQCSTFLHVEMLEGDVAWSQDFKEYAAGAGIATAKDYVQATILGDKIDG